MERLWSAAKDRPLREVKLGAAPGRLRDQPQPVVGQGL